MERGGAGRERVGLLVLVSGGDGTAWDQTLHPQLCAHTRFAPPLTAPMPPSQLQSSPQPPVTPSDPSGGSHLIQVEDPI